MRLTTAEIDRYGPLKGCRPSCDDDLTIVAGPNESGKTLYLEGLLQLLEPDVTAHMDPGPRVTQSPTGRVVVNDGGDHYTLGDGTVLSDISRVEPSHLYNLFVIRDSDLALPDGPDYYTTLVERLGDIHTTEIKALRSELVEVGRLTPGHLNLANREYDTKSAKQVAEELATDIEEYLETAEEHGIDELARRRLTLQNEFQSVQEQLATHRTAREIDNIEDASEHLEEYTDAVEHLHATDVDREPLADLREKDNDLSHAQREINSVESSLESKRAELETHQAELADTRERHTELAQREGDVERVESELETYREQITTLDADGDGTHLESRLVQRRYATIAAIVGAGISGGAGALTGSLPAILLGVVLLLIAGGAWMSHRRLTNRAAEADDRKEQLLQTARDAGFAVESPEEVAPLIRDYRDRLNAAASRVRELEAKVEQVADRVDELEGELNDATEEHQRLQKELTTLLDDADVESIDAYEERVEKKETQEEHRSQAETVLGRELGEPDGDNPEKKIAYWESKLAARRSEIGDTDIDPEQYDEATLDRLKSERETLESELAELDAALNDYQDNLDVFERRTNDLSPPPVVESSPTLQARTIEGLRSLADDLHDLVESIEQNAAISRKAISILDTIKENEEQKVATLFDPDGPASEVFSHLTNGRYTAVDYDPDFEALAVRTPDGRTFTPEQLSRGTCDQLYFAARLSLAQQLLSGKSGFLLLDDPFLAADRTRLRNGFETLSELADDGWQIMYLTAKPEVHEIMAAEFGCAVHELELLND